MGNYSDYYNFYSSYRAGTGIVGNLFQIAVAVAVIVGLWRMFVKAGEEGWKAIIPFYNGYTLAKICGKENLFWGWLGAYIGLIVSMIVVVFAAVGLVVGSFTGGSTGVSLTMIVVFSLVLLAASVAVIVLRALLCGALARSFGQSGGWAVGYFFLPAIFYCITGFVETYEYVGPDGVPAAPYQQNPYAQNPYAQNPYAQNPYQQADPYRQNPYQQTPYPQADPYAQQPQQSSPYQQQPDPGVSPYFTPAAPDAPRAPEPPAPSDPFSDSASASPYTRSEDAGQERDPDLYV